MRSIWPCIMGLAALMMGCGVSDATPAASRSPEVAPPLQRTLAIANEPGSLSLRPPRETFANTDHTRIFNADIAIADDRGVPLPYLVEALPQLGSDSWQVFPDGRMRTTYRLRPDLTWQDGTPLTASDFQFGFRVYSAPGVGLALQPPFVAMEAVD